MEKTNKFTKTPIIMSAIEYQESDLGKVGKFLIEELIPAGKLGLLTAPSKCNKTTLAWNIALSVAEGKDCIGHKNLDKGKVLYILLEGSLRGLIEKFGNSNNIDIIPDLDFQFEQYYAYINDLIAEKKYKLIIIDSLYKATNCNIANAAEVTPFLKNIEKMAKKYDATFLLLHHNSRAVKNIEQDINNVSGSFNLVRASEFTLMLSSVEKTEEEEIRELQLSKEEYSKRPRKRILKKLEYRDGGEGWDKYNLDFYFEEGYIDAYRYSKAGRERVKPVARIEDLTNFAKTLLPKLPTFNKGLLAEALSKEYPDLKKETIAKKYAPEIIDNLVQKGLITKGKRYNYATITGKIHEE